MSILTIGEFIEFFLDLIVLTCAGKCSRNRVKSLGSNKDKDVLATSGTKLPGEKAVTYHNGNTKQFANSMPPINQSMSRSQLKGRNSPRNAGGRRQGSTKSLAASRGSTEVREVMAPPPYTSRVASEASGCTRSSGLAQARSRSQPQDDTDPTDNYLLSV